MLSKSLLTAAAGNTANDYWFSVVGPGNVNNEDMADVVRDSDGNLYMLASGQGGLIFKYNTSGILQWQKTLTAGNFVGRGITCDSSGNVYLSADSMISSVQKTIVMKLNSSGTIQWQVVSQHSSTYPDLPCRGIATDGTDVFVIALSWNGNEYEPALLSYDCSTGTNNWFRQLSRTYYRFMNAICIDGNSNIYAAGGQWNPTGSNGAGSYDMIIAKWDSSGTLQWNHKLGDSGSIQCEGWGIAYCSHSNAVYVTGAIGNDILFAKYDVNGNIQYQKYSGYSNLFTKGKAIAADGQGNLYITGEVTINTGGQSHMFIQKWTQQGGLVFTRDIGGLTYNNYGYGITANADGCVAVGSTFLFSSPSSDSFAISIPIDGTLTGNYTPTFSNAILSYTNINFTSGYSAVSALMGTLSVNNTYSANHNTSTYSTSNTSLQSSVTYLN